MPTYLTINRVLILLSVIVFVLAMFAVTSPVGLVPLGLALFAAAHLVP